MKIENIEQIESIIKTKKEIPIKKYRGVYIVYKDNSVVYVGVSVCVYTRLSQHLLRKAWGIDKVEVIEIHEWWKAILIEEYLINKYNPIYNLNKNNTTYKRWQITSKKDLKELKGPSLWHE